MASVEIMMKNGVNILKTNCPHPYCMHTFQTILKLLFGIDPNQRNADRDSALHITCRMRTGREPELIKVLTTTPGNNPTLVNHKGDAPIHIACMKSRPQSLKFF